MFDTWNELSACSRLAYMQYGNRFQVPSDMGPYNWRAVHAPPLFSRVAQDSQA